jgi:hypothetical protein
VKIELNHVYKLLNPVKGWPVKDAQTLAEATQVILGSPYWDIPEDCYKVLDKNDTYCLLAVYENGMISMDRRYLAVNSRLTGHVGACG